MRNMYGEVVKPQYEIAIQRHVEGSVADDFESVDFVGCPNYREGARKAKEMSKGIDNAKQRICLVCYFQDDTSSYNQAWLEYYRDGKKEERVEF